MPTVDPSVRFVHIHSIRLANGEEVLLARALAADGKVGYGFSLTLDATEARHMAERNAGVRQDGVPAVPVPAEIEALFPSVQWLPA